jgi:hypothetical protein
MTTRYRDYDSELVELMNRFREYNTLFDMYTKVLSSEDQQPPLVLTWVVENSQSGWNTNANS